MTGLADLTEWDKHAIVSALVNDANHYRDSAVEQREVDDEKVADDWEALAARIDDLIERVRS